MNICIFIKKSIQVIFTKVNRKINKCKILINIVCVRFCFTFP
ncbi:hypothetical protein QY95_01989 [Bacillus thermotolerans]|uniref:Uncharacterized protein n=1 Tax=Bacillus thermotolerans TaxID=1221996 RepID=A0A0F5I3Q7_BACTR|nr:hypothetical protein QY95_01989 [Bacillus thermotolerans]